MAYNVHWGSIDSGATVFVAYVINGGQDQGAQFAQGSSENPGGDLVSDGHEKILSSDGNNTVTYAFQLTNFGTATNYMLEGGGLT
jgi:hypothetical protein